MTVLVGTHANKVNRCYWYSCACSCQNSNHSSNGQMSMQWLNVKDPHWHDRVQQGSKTVILRAEIRKKPELMEEINGES